MPSQTVTLDPELLSATSLQVAKEWRDASHVETAFLSCQDNVLGKGKPSFKGGERIITKILLGTHSSPTELFTGFEVQGLGAAGVQQVVDQTPFHVVWPVLISEEEQELQGAEMGKVLGLWDGRMKRVLDRARTQLNRAIVQGSVAAHTRCGTINGTDVASGLIEEDAAQTNVIGGFSKATWAAEVGAANLRYDGGGSANSGLLPGLNSLLSQRRQYVSGEVQLKTKSLCSVNAYGHYKSVLQAYERYVNSKALDATSLELGIDGKPALVEYYMPTTGTNSTAQPWGILIHDFSAMHFWWSRGEVDGYFGLSKIEKVSGSQDVMVQKVHVRGQLVVYVWNTSALLTNVETF